MGRLVAGVIIGVALGYLFALRAPPIGTMAAAVRERLPGDTRPLDELTKDELYEIARRVDLSGRSGMSKDELMAALRKQGSG